MLSTVAVGTDGSTTASKAVDAAVEIAQRFDARLVLLSAFANKGASAEGSDELQWAHSNDARVREMLSRTEQDLRNRKTLYVLEGEFRFKLGDDLHPAPPGSFVFVPQGATHSFQNVGETQGRMLIHFTPSGMERFFEEFAALPAPDPGAFAEVAQVVQMEVMGPPLARSDPT